jgi:hypothetical protein
MRATLMLPVAIVVVAAAAFGVATSASNESSPSTGLALATTVASADPSPTGASAHPDPAPTTSLTLDEIGTPMPVDRLGGTMAIELPLPGSHDGQVEPGEERQIGSLEIEPHEGGGLDAPDLPIKAAGVGTYANIKAWAGCAVQCITSGIVHSRGFGAELQVITDTDAVIVIGVTDPGTGVTSYQQSTQRVKHFSATFTDLKPETTYTTKAAATDAAGRVSLASGTFTTEDVDRTLKITFSPIELIEHPSVPDDAQVRIFVRVNDVFLDHSAWIIGIAPLTEMRQHLDLEVWVVYTHYPGVKSFPNPGGVPVGACTQPPESPPIYLLPDGDGSDRCRTWASAVVHGVDLDEAPTAGTGSHTLHRTLRRFAGPSEGDSLPPGYGASSPPFQMRVPVALEVTYS